MAAPVEQAPQQPITAPVPAWHALAVDAAGAALEVDPAVGLAEGEAQARLARHGPNRLVVAHEEPVWEAILEEVREPMILLLLITGGLYSIWGGLRDTVTIFVVIAIVVGVEIGNERRAGRAVAALARLAEPTAPVRRAGTVREIPAGEVVAGDVLLLLAGRRVAADARLVEAYGLTADEASLTGESVPVAKAVAALPAETPLAERTNLVYAGTTITRGRGIALAVATGPATAVGRIAGLTARVKSPRTPLQRTMRELTGWMIWLALGFSALVPLLGWLHGGQSARQMLLTGLALAFATIPEELPILITLVLALGAYRLAQQRAIVKHLRAAETLSAVTVIATDKTGTLTENHMAVQRILPSGQEHEALLVGLLCNDAVESNGTASGDPLEVATLEAAWQAGVDVAALRRAFPVHTSFSFDSERAIMATVHVREGTLWAAVKGAPEAIVARLDPSVTAAEREEILTAAAAMAGEGLRVIACAEKTVGDGPLTQDSVEDDLTYVGLLGLADPPRPEVAAAIADCRGAGLRTILITGDHPLTARAIAQQVGLPADDGVRTGQELDALTDAGLREALRGVSVYARTTPEHKLRIVQALQAGGAVVAVTGDGVNDAPALAAADIGVAMGETGTDVARAAADIVLADDNFATVVQAVRVGRQLFANLRKAIRYYLACKVALVAVTLLPALLGVPVPFSPVQIILLELFMDLGASVTFVAERAESDLMRQPPRDARAPFLDRRMIGSIFLAAAGLFAAVAMAYLITYHRSGLAPARTVAFDTWLLGHVLLALNLRADREPLRRLGVLSNRLLLIWGGVAGIAILLATLVPGLHTALNTVALSPGTWALVIGAAVVGTCWIEVRKVIRNVAG